MGQEMTREQRREVLDLPNVAYATEEHIILKDGTVVDPSEFAVRTETVFLIKKLLSCHCEGRPHRIGHHEIVMQTVGVTILETYIGDAENPSYCPSGLWTTEEQLSPKQALKYLK